MHAIHDKLDSWYSHLCHWADNGEYEIQRDLDRIGKWAETWATRAAVKKNGAQEFIYDSRLPDFLPELLPFQNHPDFINAPEPFRAAALSCAWLAYNEKTVAIESKIVGPACVHLIDGNVDLDAQNVREPVAQALVDESYHILMVVKASELTRKLRGLTQLRLPQFQIVTSLLHARAAHSEQWKKTLVQLATAVVAEILVSDYLSLISRAMAIQPLNRITTEMHRRDEATHNGLFKCLGSMIYHSLRPHEREFFVRALAEPSGWFADPELDVWQSVLSQIEFPNAERIIRDCRVNHKDREVHLDLSTLEVLFADFGVDEKIREQVVAR
jgi:hypothetical protein